MHGKDKCSICGNYTDIFAKVTSDPDILYCKNCSDAETDRLQKNFMLMKFICIRCGSANVIKEDLKVGINEDVINFLNGIVISLYAVARLACIDCKNVFHVNFLDNGPRTK